MERTIEDDLADSILSTMEQIQSGRFVKTNAKRRKKKREAGTLSYKSWRYAVFSRDKFTCQKCGKKLPADELEAHHIKPFSVAPELEHVVSNGMALCHECHVETDSFGGRGHFKENGDFTRKNGC
jgi:5-methylcytosine-specific restriction endonuclease McrA